MFLVFLAWIILFLDQLYLSKKLILLTLHIIMVIWFQSLSVQDQYSLSELSESDVAKFPALFGVRQIIKSDPQEARLQLSEVHFNVNIYINIVTVRLFVCWLPFSL